MVRVRELEMDCIGSNYSLCHQVKLSGLVSSIQKVLNLKSDHHVIVM